MQQFTPSIQLCSKELSLYFKLLKPGGILFGDDYGWPAVKEDGQKGEMDRIEKCSICGLIISKLFYPVKSYIYFFFCKLNKLTDHFHGSLR